MLRRRGSKGRRNSEGTGEQQNLGEAGTRIEVQGGVGGGGRGGSVRSSSNAVALKAKGGGNRKNSEESGEQQTNKKARNFSCLSLVSFPSFSCLHLLPSSPRNATHVTLYLCRNFSCLSGNEFRFPPVSSRRRRDVSCTVSVSLCPSWWVGKRLSSFLLWPLESWIFQELELLHQLVSCDVFTAFQHCLNLPTILFQTRGRIPVRLNCIKRKSLASKYYYYLMLHLICYKEVSMVGSTTLIGMTSKQNVDDIRIKER